MVHIIKTKGGSHRNCNAPVVHFNHLEYRFYSEYKRKNSNNSQKEIEPSKEEHKYNTPEKVMHYI